MKTLRPINVHMSLGMCSPAVFVCYQSLSVPVKVMSSSDKKTPHLHVRVVSIINHSPFASVDPQKNRHNYLITCSIFKFLTLILVTAPFF